MASTSQQRIGDTVAIEDARAATRYLMGGAISCNLGKVINLSMAGALVVARAPHVDCEIPFHVGDGSTTLRCMAHVVRTRRLGLKRYECAVSFSDLTAEQTEVIARLVKSHRSLAMDVERRAA